MKVATWNVNSIRARQGIVLDWLRLASPDVLCMQETKVVDQDFPTEEFGRLGYQVLTAGQKAYNGVAIASRLPMSDRTAGLDRDTETAEARSLAATIDGIRVSSAYVPNGKAVDSPSFADKIDWLGRLRDTLAAAREQFRDIIVCGDFNIAPDERDVYAPEKFRGQVHFHPEEHRALGAILELGFHDAFRLHHASGGAYSWWDYRAGSFARNRGLRIDLVLVSGSLRHRSEDCFIDKGPRRLDKPSDHAPVVARFG